jgi:CRP-like cAMP-binding protein
MSSPLRAKNLFLARLPPTENHRLSALMRPVTLKFKQVIHKFREPIEFVYFPTRGAASAITIMQDGSAIEIATIGNEGVVGHSIFDGDDNTSSYDVIIQIAGDALRMEASVLKQEATKEGPFRRLLLRYNKAFVTQISQSVACNGLHAVQQRCCRWLLITLDRMESNEMPLTHEFLGVMLGVRRSTVTDVLGPLHERGLLSNSRGIITILDRAGLEELSCECYLKVKDEFERLIGGL